MKLNIAIDKIEASGVRNIASYKSEDIVDRTSIYFWLYRQTELQSLATLYSLKISL